MQEKGQFEKWKERNSSIDTEWVSVWLENWQYSVYDCVLGRMHWRECKEVHKEQIESNVDEVWLIEFYDDRSSAKLSSHTL